jgi:3-isopropylmalate/(R)-2-methylmalate dehydratase small subunit
MEKFVRLETTAVVMDQNNIDTDQILPKQFLTGISREGYGKYLFNDWRYTDGDTAQPIPDFILNTEAAKRARILISGKNFGCGSSREHAPWAIADFGFRCIIAESFADIFFNNCLNNGILPVVLTTETISELKNHLKTTPNLKIEVDLETQKVGIKDLIMAEFTITSTAKENLLNGWDKIGKTLSESTMIGAFEVAQPSWLR